MTLHGVHGPRASDSALIQSSGVQYRLYCCGRVSKNGEGAAVVRIVRSLRGRQVGKDVYVCIQRMYAIRNTYSVYHLTWTMHGYRYQQLIISVIYGYYYPWVCADTEYE